MKLFLSFFIAAFAVLIGCDDSDTDIKKANASEWSSDFPKVVQGAVTADLMFKTTGDSKVFWVLAPEGSSYSPEEIRELAEKRTSASSIVSGMSVTNAMDVLTSEAQKLKENQRYTAHFVLADTEGNMDSEVKTLSFTTYARQDTLQFKSTAEDRDAYYLMYRPEEVLKNPGKKYPIAFFLTGYGEVGTKSQPIAMIHNGSLTEYIHKGNDVPFMVMSIQHIKENWNNDLINEAIDHALTTYPVDDKKMYLIGMSGGAFGVWAFAQEHPERLAAIVPISGTGDTDKACRLRNLAIYGIHNGIDEVVHPGRTTSMIKAVEECNPMQEVRALLFPDSGHNAWRRVFDPNHEDWKLSPESPRIDIYQWLLSKSKISSGQG